MLDASYILLAKYDLLLRTKPSDPFGQDVRVTISTTGDSVAKKIEPTAVQQAPVFVDLNEWSSRSTCGIFAAWIPRSLSQGTCDPLW